MALAESFIVLARLNYLWRLFVTGSGFLFFGLGGFVLATLVFPLIRLCSGASGLKRIRWCIHKAFSVFFWYIEVMGAMRLDVRHRELLLNAKGCLVIANHPTLIDVVAIVSLMPSVCCVVKKELWKNPLLQGVVRAAGYISNSDPDRLVDDCANALLSGESIILFPEGTRTRPDQPLSFQRGAAYLALRSGVPVLPVLIDCTPITLSKKHAWYHIPDRRFHLRIEARPPIVLDDWLSKETLRDLDPPKAARVLTRAFETYFSQELYLWTH